MTVTIEQLGRKYVADPDEPVQVIYRLPLADYFAIPGVTISSLLEIAESPKHYRYRLEHGRPDTRAMHLGRAAHTAVLEPMQFLREYVLMPAEFPDAKGNMKPASRQLNSCKAWCESQEEAGRSVLSREEYDTAEAIRDAVMDHGVAGPLASRGRSEVVLVWKDPETGIPCKGRIDKLDLGHVDPNGDPEPDFFDLKTARRIGAAAFGRDAARLMYHVRMAWYADAIWQHTGIEPIARVTAVQSVGPYDVAVCRLNHADLEAGRRVKRSLMSRLRECHVSGRWPGVAPDEIDLQLPAWSEGGRQEVETITMGGETMAF